VGGEEWPDNPRYKVPEPFHVFVRLWAVCRSGMGGLAHWPDAGGVNDQAAWVVDAFSALAAMEAEFDKAREAARR